MREHTWVIETVSAPTIGDGDFWRCTACGCGGGEDSRTPRPFLPGAAIDLSEDWRVAHEQASFFMRGYLRAWHIRSLRTNDVKEHELLRLLHAADRYTPNARPRVDFYQVVFDCADPVGRERRSIVEVMERLVGMGFKLESSPCVECGKPSERAADDKDRRCMSCWWAAFKKSGKSFLFS